MVLLGKAFCAFFFLVTALKHAFKRFHCDTVLAWALVLAADEKEEASKFKKTNV